MRRFSQAGSAAFLLVALFVMYEARTLNYYTKQGPGAGFFPFWLGLTLAMLSLAWLAQASLKPAEPLEAGFIPNRRGAFRILSILLALATFIALVDVIGFSVVTFAFLLFLLRALGRRSLAITLAISLTGSFGVYYVFRHWLGVQLPASSIGLLRNLGI
jgi:putative tricarboxylic transport membrane protein